MPHDVADDEGDLAAGERDDVVPVASHVHALSGGEVAGGGRARGQAGEDLGEEAALEFAGAGVLGVVEPGPLQGLGDERADGRQEGAFLVGEAPWTVEGQDTHSEGVSGRRQRQDRPRLLVGALGAVGQRGRVRGHLLYRGQEQGSAGRDRVPGRVAGRPGAVVEEVEEVGRVPDGSDVAEQVVLDGLDQQAGGPEGGQHPPGDGVHHIA